MSEVGTVQVATYGFIWEIKKSENIFTKNNEAIVSPFFCSGDNYKWKIIAEVKVSTIIFIVINDQVDTGLIENFSFFDSANKKWRSIRRVPIVNSQLYSLEWSYYMDTRENDDFLKNDIKILCEISTFLNRKKHQQNAMKDFESLFKSEKLSDVTVKVKDKSFRLHKCILAARSPIFSAMFTDDFKEKAESTVIIEDIEPKVMEKLFQYIYTGDVSNIHEVASDLLAAADMYDVTGLKDMCEKFFQTELNVTNAISMLLLSDKYNACHLKGVTLKFVAASFKEVMATDFDHKLLSQSLYYEVLKAVAENFGPIRV